MRILTMLILFMAFTRIFALGLDDIIRLNRANIGDKIIVALIEQNEINQKITVKDITSLKKMGISDAVILALVKKSPSCDQARELNTFDKFYLSSYYSHQYGWPEPNYQNPKEILEQGLLYQPPHKYPHARRRRVRGWEFSIYPRRKHYRLGLSPYTRIIREKNFNRCDRNTPNFSLMQQSEEKPLIQLSQKKSFPTQPNKYLGEWHLVLLKITDDLEKSMIRMPSSSREKMNLYIPVMRQYGLQVDRLLQRIRRQNRQKLGLRLQKKWKRSSAQQKQAIISLYRLMQREQLDLKVEDEVIELIQYHTLWEKRRGNQVIALKNIVSRMEIIHNKFTDLHNRIESLLPE